HGRMTDTLGDPWRNSEVSLFPVTPAMPGMKRATPPAIPGRLTADVTFTVAQVPAGQYVLQVDAPGFERSSQEVTLPTTQTFAIKLEVLEIPGAENAPAAVTGQADTQAMEAQVATLEKRGPDLDANTDDSQRERGPRKT